MNLPGMNLTEYSSAELSVLIHAVSTQRLDASMDLIVEKKNAQRRLDILDQWYVKLIEARKLVRDQEKIQLS